MRASIRQLARHASRAKSPELLPEICSRRGLIDIGKARKNLDESLLIRADESLANRSR